MTHSIPLSPSTFISLSSGRAFGMTDVGLVRKSNEDNFLIDAALGLVLVTDGMGGHKSGDIASAEAALAIQAFLANKASHKSPPFPTADASVTIRYSPPSDPDATISDDTLQTIMSLFDAIEFANSRLYAQNITNNMADGSGMGTTLTGFWQPNTSGAMAVFHVGDSRLYRYRDTELSQLTRDHTLYQQALDDGKFENLPSRNQLLQAIGPLERVKPEITPQRANPNDLFLLCSDGLHGCAPHGLIAEILSKTNKNNLDKACAALIASAKEYGSRDNITVVLVAF